MNDKLQRSVTLLCNCHCYGAAATLLRNNGVGWQEAYNIIFKKRV